MCYIKSFLVEFNIGRQLLLNLSINDLKARYAGSVLGIAWSYIQPLITILVFWYVFQVGFRNPPVNNVPFILWFSAAYIPWLLFSDAITTSANSLYEYNYLIKKIKFPIVVLPLVKVLSSLIIHMFFILFLYFLFIIYGYEFQPVWFEILYYTFSLLCLLSGMSFFLASVSVFFKDFSQLVNVLLQVGFWLTPIFWSPSGMDDVVLRTVQLNPLYYITQGYRDALIYGIGFTNNMELTIYFWSITIIVFFVGIFMFQKLRIHFSDIL